jgi:hypothetical protein
VFAAYGFHSTCINEKLASLLTSGNGAEDNDILAIDISHGNGMRSGVDNNNTVVKLMGAIHNSSLHIATSLKRFF